MAILLNKWLLFSFFICLTANGFTKNAHPFHVSTTEFFYNNSEKTLEISCKLFWDDFEECLRQNYAVKPDLSDPKKYATNDPWVKKYVESHLSIKLNNAAYAPTYLGYERKEEAVVIYMEIPKLNSVTSLAVKNTLFHELFKDQISIMHGIVNGTRKSTKLDYPASQWNITF